MTTVSVPLGSLVRIRTGSLDANQADIDGIYPFFTCATEPLKINSYSFDCDAILLAGNGDLNVKHYVGKFDAYQRTYVVESLDKNTLNSRYLYYFLNKYVEKLRQMSIGGVIKYIKLGMLTEACFPLPPINEQRRIAAILDKGNAICEKRSKGIKLTDEFLRSSFFDLFGDPVTNSKGLPEKPIAEFARVTTGNTPSREIDAYFGNHIEWIKSDNLNTPFHFLTKATEGLSEAGLSVARSVPAGSTLITCIAGSPSCIGNAALADRKVSFNQQINALTPKPSIEPEFLYAATLFSKPRIQAASTNGMKGMVSKGALEQVRFILPPQDQREKFAAIFCKVMELIEKLESSASEAKALYGSLAQHAFQGKL